MWRRSLTMTLVGLVLNLSCVAPAASGSSLTRDEKRVIKFKRQIAKTGTGPRARIKVRLRDQSELSGFVSAVGDDYLIISDPTTQVATSLKFAQIDRLKLMSRAGSTMSSGVTPAGVFNKALIAFGLVLTAVALGCVASKRCVE